MTFQIESVPNERFEQFVREGIEALPEWVRREINNVTFLIEDEPSERQRIENEVGDEDILFGLYEGVPLTERGDESPFLPDTITIFRGSILGTYTTEAEIQACVHNTIWHEVAHYFGHDEEWVEAEELRRGKLL